VHFFFHVECATQKASLREDANGLIREFVDRINFGGFLKSS
jgi:hypothetical protein